MRITRFQASRRGFTLIEILIVISILGLLLAIAVPNFVKTRTNAQRQICIENLAQIESAKQIWGVEVGRTYGDTPQDAELIGPTLYIKEKPRCPAGGNYRFNAIGTTAACDVNGHVL
jgi:prepilin-type N-terminal cleavage/methylation domain-containing protein